ncbi:MAG: TIM44-like domain-containing protein [Syntrophomonas sp.]
MYRLGKHSKYIILGLALLMALTVVIAPIAYAGVGNSVSHSSSSSSSSGGSYSGGSDFLTGYLIGALFHHPLLLLVLLVIVFIVYKSRGSNKQTAALHDEMAAAYDRDYDKPVDLSVLKASDENFFEDDFIAWVNNMFLQLQEAWQEKDWKKVRPFESDELFNTHNKQLQEYVENHTTNVIDEIAILRTSIVDHRDSANKEVLDVYLKMRMKDYIIDDKSRKVLEGDPKKEINMEYLLTLARKKGVKTKVTEHTSVTRCPSCGASVSINASGECEYCNSIVSNGDYDWVLTKMEVISQS